MASRDDLFPLAADCDQLWNLSLHPNFLEWLHRVAWTAIAVSSPSGWIAIQLSPYQVEVSIFIP